MSNEALIAEARRQVGHIEDKSMRERLISDLADALEAATRERDAAVAALERVRAIHRKRGASWPHKGGVYVCGADNGMWPCPTVAALDGAPKPEEKP